MLGRPKTRQLVRNECDLTGSFSMQGLSKPGERMKKVNARNAGRIKYEAGIKGIKRDKTMHNLAPLGI